MYHTKLPPLFKTQELRRATRVLFFILIACFGWWLYTRIDDVGSRIDINKDSVAATTHAAIKLGNNTVDSHTIINNSITSDDIALNSITANQLNSDITNWMLKVDMSHATHIGELSALQQTLENLQLPTLDLPVSLDDLADDVTSLLQNTTHVLDNSITSLHVVDGTISALDLSPGSINAMHIVDEAVTSLKILDGAVSGNDIAANAVAGLHIIDGAVGADDIAASTIGSSHLIDGSVTGLDLAAATITASNIALSTITGDLIAGNTIGTLHLAEGAVTALQLADGSVGADALIDGAVTSLKILDGSIGSNDLGLAIISTTNIALSSITSELIADGTIDSIDITDNAITITKLADGAVTGAKISDGSITSSDIFDGTINSNDIAPLAITNGLISNGTIQTSKLTTASNKKTVSVQIGDIGALVLSTIERPVFVAPTNGTITKITFTDGGGITAGLNKGTISVERKTAPAATVASAALTTISLAGFSPYSPPIGGGATFNTGDVYTFKYAPGLLGVTFTGFLVTIEYVANE